MAVPTGTAKLSDIRTEWNRTGSISMSEMYRGGTYVKGNASDNTAVNLAADVPTTGAISVDDFRGEAKGWRKTYTATATDQDASAIFGDDYDVDYPKEIVINSGVELGATSTSQEALHIDAGGVGTITVTNNGTITGAGGAAGTDGGDAFEAEVACVVINNGTIRAGGGGGGTGGSGNYQSGNTAIGQGWGLAWNNCNISCTQRHGAGTFCDPGCGSNCNCQGWGYHCNDCRRYNYTSTSGGAGGVGAGYNQSAGSGSAGGTNAGSGGSGGAFGAAASSGGNGNVGNGAAGGAAGNYIRGNSNVTLTNNGTLTGSIV